MAPKTETVWVEFSNQLKRFILGRISDPSLADDILQEVFVKIHSRIDTLRDDSKIRTWIYQITRNTIIDYYRSRKITLEIPEDIDESHKDPLDTPSQELSFGLEDMIKELPEKYGQALMLTEFQGLPQREVAQKLGISVSGAKSRVQRARRMLKDSLMRCCHIEFDRYGTIIDYHPITCCCCAAAQSEKNS